MHKLILVFSIALFGACINAPKAKYSDLQYEGLFSPAFVHFNNTDTIEILPIPGELIIDSISSEFYNLKLVNSLFQFVRSNNTPPSLSNCVVYQDGIPLGLPLIKGKANIESTSRITLLDSDRSFLYTRIENAKEVLAYWNNLRVDISNTSDSFKITIPPFAKYTENSHITLFIVDSKGYYDQAIVPLRKGKVVRGIEKLRKPMVEDGLSISIPHLQKLANIDFQPIIRKFAEAELKKPSAIAGIYGQYNKLLEDTSLLIIEARYFDQRSLVYFNKSKEEIEEKEFADSSIIVKPYSALLISRD